MGGCYEASFSYSRPEVAKKPRAKPNPDWQKLLASFARSYDTSDLTSAYKEFFRSRKKPGFFAKLANATGIDDVRNIPKEFPEIEYEVKFDVQPSGKENEPGIEQYLDAFDFPASASSRFIKDPINSTAVGVNHFIGDGLDERLVVIEKGGKTFLKEKGVVLPLNLGIPYEHLVMKREETRYQSPMESIISKVRQTTSEEGVEYRGKIRKEKGDAFILDTNDGRLYSMSFTRAHLTKPNQKEESATQRQLEFEYAGYIPGFKPFEKNSERQIVKGMVDLAKYVLVMYHETPLTNGWTANLELTNERKYDFVAGLESAKIAKGEVLRVPLLR